MTPAKLRYKTPAPIITITPRTTNGDMSSFLFRLRFIFRCVQFTTCQGYFKEFEKLWGE